jgi:hypothetical protein
MNLRFGVWEQDEESRVNLEIYGQYLRVVLRSMDGKTL